MVLSSASMCAKQACAASVAAALREASAARISEMEGSAVSVLVIGFRNSVELLSLNHFGDFEEGAVGFRSGGHHGFALERRTRRIGPQRAGRVAQHFSHLRHRLDGGCVQLIQLSDVSENGVEVAPH